MFDEFNENKVSFGDIRCISASITKEITKLLKVVSKDYIGKYTIKYGSQLYEYVVNHCDMERIKHGKDITVEYGSQLYNHLLSLEDRRINIDFDDESSTCLV
jgi:hypothetical protein